MIDTGDPRARLLALVGELPDPEIPVVTLADLGILRDLTIAADGSPRVVLTPTYSGCPATEAIAAQVRETLQAAGHPDASVELRLAPAWTTDWISEDGRRKLRSFGSAGRGPTRLMSPRKTFQNCGISSIENLRMNVPTRVMRFHDKPPADGPVCPRCDSPNVEELSRHGSTPCKALYRCKSCREPFDHFKPY
ncbi:MAG TPA: iron-sulfur cluster assembly protein [Burkholderiaceae bacterium]|nr:iron-sulfur cluster assembly protein [Burkholderiaceae bacterium]